MRSLVSLVLAVPILLGACVTETETETTEQPLNGDWQTFECTGPERDKLTAAFAVIQQRLGSSDYLECVKSAYMIETHGAIVEDMVAMLRELPTTVYCVNAGACPDGAAACAHVPSYGDDEPEVLSVVRDFLASDDSDPETLAGIIVHEAAHTKGWSHFPEFLDIAYPWSVNVQTGTCMANLDNDGWSRDDPHGDAELSPVGGTGGQPFHLRCPAGQRVSGLTVDTSSYVNRLQLRCSDGSVTPRTGELKDSTSTITHDCPADSSLVGLRSRSDSMVRSLRSYCASNTDLANDVPDPALTSLYLGGSSTGTLAMRRCPIGMSVVGAVGRSGARIDQVRWLCADVDGAELPNPHVWGYRGTKAGNSKLEMCSGHGAIRALYGRAGGEVNLLGAECYPTRPAAATGLPTVWASNATRHGLDLNGGGGGAVFNKPCPTGKLMVGLRFRSGARIDAIGGLCADPEAWASGSTATTNVSLSGGTTGTYSVLTCPSREFLVGLQTWAAPTPAWSTTTVHAVQPLCRRLDAP